MVKARKGCLCELEFVRTVEVERAGDGGQAVLGVDREVEGMASSASQVEGGGDHGSGGGEPPGGGQSDALPAVASALNAGHKFRFVVGEGQAKQSIDDLVCEMEIGELRRLRVDTEDQEYFVKLVSVEDPLGADGAEKGDSSTLAAALRAIGNDHFRREEYEQALGSYRRALWQLQDRSSTASADLEAALRSNAAICLSKLERWREAVYMAESTLRVVPTHRKARFSRGMAWKQLGEYGLAILDLEHVIASAPDNEKDRRVELTLRDAKDLQAKKIAKDREDFKRTYHLDIKW